MLHGSAYVGVVVVVVAVRRRALVEAARSSSGGGGEVAVEGGGGEVAVVWECNFGSPRPRERPNFTTLVVISCSCAGNSDHSLRLLLARTRESHGCWQQTHASVSQGRQMPPRLR